MGANVGMRALARELGVSHQAVGKAIASGRLKASVTKRGKRVDIDVDLARAEWAANTDSRKQRENARKKAYTGPGELFDPAGARAAKLQAEARAEPGGPTLTSARVMRESYMARLARLEYQEREGRLVDTEEVRKNEFEKGKVIRVAVLSMINQLVPTLCGMGAGPEIDVRRLLEDRFTQALEELAVGHLGASAA